MASPSLSTGYPDCHDPAAIPMPAHDIEMFGGDEQDPLPLPRLLCDCPSILANGQVPRELPEPSRLVGRNHEPCLECALFVARRGDLLTKDDLCFAYFGSRRCSHCIRENHDCSRIHCDILREAVNRLFRLCQQYFFADEARTLQLATSIFEQQYEVLFRYAASEDLRLQIW